MLMFRHSMIAALILAAVFFFGEISGSRSQVQSLNQVFNMFTPTARAPDSSVTTSSSRVTLGTKGQVGWVCNTGSNAAFVRFGDSTVVASATADMVVLAGQCVALNAGGATHLASITATSTATLITTIGQGRP